jgi:hypothetical protein
MITAITALVTSISSIAIALHHGHVMEMLVPSVQHMSKAFASTSESGM